ncbi:MAG: hypothetical protein ACTSPI_03335 [Candidatus Heimdallarchaeaceae archaeon]
MFVNVEKLKKFQVDPVEVEYIKGVTLYLVPISPKVFDDITRKCTSYKWKHGQKVEKLNEDLRNELLWDEMISDWKGIYVEGTNEEWPCTKDNKILLMLNDMEFSSFVQSACLNINDYKIEKEEEDFENLEPSPSSCVEEEVVEN